MGGRAGARRQRATDAGAGRLDGLRLRRRPHAPGCDESRPHGHAALARARGGQRHSAGADAPGTAGERAAARARRGVRGGGPPESEGEAVSELTKVLRWHAKRSWDNPDERAVVRELLIEAARVLDAA